MSDNSDVEFCLVSKELLEDRLVSAKAKAMYAPRITQDSPFQRKRSKL